MKEMIQKNKGRLICSAFVMCVGIILGYTFENSLWINGTFAVTYVVIMAVTFYDNRNRQQRQGHKNGYVDRAGNDIAL